jgi:hypothetical protein
MDKLKTLNRYADIDDVEILVTSEVCGEHKSLLVSTGRSPKLNGGVWITSVVDLNWQTECLPPSGNISAVSKSMVEAFKNHAKAIEKVTEFIRKAGY